jgi:hypothetical protein
MVRKVVLTIVAAVAVLVLDAVTPLGLALWFLQVVLVWIATLWANRRQMLALAAICATFIVPDFWLSPKSGLVTWVDECNVLLSLGTVWALTHSCLRQRATEDARRKAEREIAQAQETVRILRGLLSICAWCKKRTRSKISSLPRYSHRSFLKLPSTSRGISCVATFQSSSCWQLSASCFPPVLPQAECTVLRTQWCSELSSPHSKEANTHGRLPVLIEAGSLLNDGTAAVAFGVVIALASERSLLQRFFSPGERTEKKLSRHSGNMQPSSRTRWCCS